MLELRGTSCELLSKRSIFDISNNGSTVFSGAVLVVNCFQNVVSLILATTSTAKKTGEVLL